MILSVALLIQAAAVDAPIEVPVALADGRCTVTIAGRAIDPQGEPEAMKPAVRSLPKGRAVKLVGSETIPYRCIGGAIYTLQRHGVAKVGFVAGR
jgi:hypothetical protein